LRHERTDATQAHGVGLDALKAAAFDLSPDPALVVDADGALVAVNEAAEALFGQGLGLLARGRFRAALPHGSAMVSLLAARCRRRRVRERGVQISLFGLPAVRGGRGGCAPGRRLCAADAQRQERARQRAQRPRGRRLRSLVGMAACWRTRSRNPLAGIRGAAQLLKSAPRPRMRRWRS
jgi:two-component system nitrogen regulation sensor histidine kinase GlnL